MLAYSLFLLAGLLPGCSCDCDSGSAHVVIIDSPGVQKAVNAVYYQYESEEPAEAECYRSSSPFGQCSEWFFPTDREGLYSVEVIDNSELVGAETFELDFGSAAYEDTCCESGFTAELEITYE